MFQIGYYITDTNMGKVLDARVEPVLSPSAVESVVLRLNGPLVRLLFLGILTTCSVFAEFLEEILADPSNKYKMFF